VLVMFGGIAWVIASGQGGVWQFVLAWGLGGLVGAVVAAILLRLVPGLRRSRSWFVDNGDLAARYAFDDFASQGTQQLTNFVVAGFAGLKDVGALRGAQSAFAPPSILGLGVQGAATPELVRALRRSTKKLHRDVLGLSAGLATFSLVWGVVTLTVPDSVGQQLFGDTWQAAQPLLIYYCVAQVANGLRTGPEAGLRALGAADRTVRARVWVSMIGVAGQVAGALVAGALGVAVATAIIKPFQMVIWYLYYRGARYQAAATGQAFLTQLRDESAAPGKRLGE
jgi:O-antigen/teichoic acid export membrane protein